VRKQTFANILKKLEKEVIISRKVIESRPLRVEYSLTEKGKKVAEMLGALNRMLSVFFNREGKGGCERVQGTRSPAQSTWRIAQEHPWIPGREIYHVCAEGLKSRWTKVKT